MPKRSKAWIRRFTSFMRRVYRNSNHALGYASPERLYSFAIKKFPSLKRRDVFEFLRSQPSYTLFVRKKGKIDRHKFLVGGPHLILAADLIDMQKWGSENEGVKYILLTIDGFSRFVRAFALKDKTKEQVTYAMEGIFREMPSYKKLHVDYGREFYNRTMDALLNKYGVERYSTGTGLKSMIAERANLTLQKRLFRILHDKNTFSWVSILPQAVKAMNDSPHSAFKGRFSPRQVHEGKTGLDKETLFRLVYGSVEENKERRKYLERLQKQRDDIMKIKEGSIVRIKENPFRFARGYFPLNSRQLYRVRQVIDMVPRLYKLSELDSDTHIPGVFYWGELIPSQEESYYPVRILDSRINPESGRREYETQFIDYPQTPTRWTMERLKKL